MPASTRALAGATPRTLEITERLFTRMINHLADAAQIIEQSGMRAYAPFVLIERAHLADVEGDDVSCGHRLKEAHGLFSEMGAPIRAAQVEGELGA